MNRARYSARHITLKTVERAVRLKEKLPPGRAVHIWAEDLPGFALRPRGAARDIPYIIDSKHKGAQHKKVVGHVSYMKPEEAYDRARPLICNVKSGQGLKAGKPEITVSQLTEEYMADCEERNKPTTKMVNRSRIRQHINPAMGHRLVRSIGRDDIAALHRSMANIPRQANDTFRLLRAMFNWAEREGYRDRVTNPCKEITLYRQNSRDRHLSDEELARFAATLEQLKTDWPFGVAALCLLLFTGARKSEILSLSWKDVHLSSKVPHLELKDSKTGKSYRVLSEQAVAQFRQLEKLGAERYPNHEYVFPSPRIPGRPLTKLDSIWEEVRMMTRLENFRLHDLRHTYASLAVGEDVELFAIGKLLGHADSATTAGYAHLPTKTAKAHADKVGNAIGKYFRMV